MTAKQALAGPPPAPHPEPAGGPLLVAVQGAEPEARALAGPLAADIRSRLGVEPVVLVATARGGSVELLPPDAGPPGRHQAPPAAASQGAVPAHASPLGPLLQAGAARGACALAIVSAERHDPDVEWLRLLVDPVLRGGYDLVCPAYRRPRTAGGINSGIVAPLLRALHGPWLHQPLGTELALSPALGRWLLDDRDWQRRPSEAGSDAWLLLKVLGERFRVAQSWLGSWPAPRRPPEEPSQLLVRALGLLFTEMERDAGRWQRGGAGRPAATFGTPAFEPADAALDPVQLAASFAAGLRDLRPVLGLVLPPASLLALERAAAPGSPPGIPDELWARVIYDFAVGHMTRGVERRQLLASLTPLYLGWLAGLVAWSAALDDGAFEARLDALGQAFASQRRYLVARWRWPDEFNP
jgi:hypothetical protein